MSYLLASHRLKHFLQLHSQLLYVVHHNKCLHDKHITPSVSSSAIVYNCNYVPFTNSTFRFRYFRAFTIKLHFVTNNIVAISHTTSCLLVYCGKSRRHSSAYASKTFWIVYNQHSTLTTLFLLTQ